MKSHPSRLCCLPEGFLIVVVESLLSNTEHRADGKDFTNMTIIGRPSTAEGAGKWEEVRINTYKRNHGGDRPKYNQNDSGK